MAHLPLGTRLISLLPVLALPSSVLLLDSLSLDRLNLDDGSVLCAVDSPSLTVSLTGPGAPSFPEVIYSPSLAAVSCVPEATKCAWFCFWTTNCTNYSYDRSLRTCQMFDYRPLHFVISQTCTHYMNERFDGFCMDIRGIVNLTVEASGAEQVRSMIPSQCCGFPFTYNGQLYHSCTWNRTYTVDIGCFVRGRRWLSCLPPSDYISEYELRNLTFDFDNTTTTKTVETVNDWIVIHERGANYSTEYNLTWDEYRNGFGSIDQNFWLGLENVYQLSSDGGYRLRVELQSSYNRAWYSVEYESFSLSNETEGYAIHLSGCSGDACDPFEYGTGSAIQNHHKFSTWDRNNGNLFLTNCGMTAGGGFWFNSCSSTLLTGTPFHRCKAIPPVNGVPNYYDLSYSRMMIKYDP